MAKPTSVWVPRGTPLSLTSPESGGYEPGGNGGDGNGMPTTNEEKEMAQRCGCSVDQLRSLSASVLRYMTAELRSGSGSGNQGYAQCVMDRLMLEIAKGKCSPARIQCRQQIPLVARGLAAGAVATHAINPVGLAVTRELIVHAILNDAEQPADPLAVFDVTLDQMEALGRTAFAGNQQVTGAAVARAGTLLATYLPEKQNYVLPSGVAFDGSQNLLITITNRSAADAISYSATLTYDVIRWG